MISIGIPSEDGETVYRACVKRTQDAVLKGQLTTETSRVVARTQLYLSMAPKEELYLLPQEGSSIDGEMRRLYDRALVDGGERPTYEKLKSLARYGRCPLCAQRDVKTLDHYLPRKVFPEFSVFPPNLIPCCTDCNKVKLTHVATSYETQLFHPYFDDWSNVVILKATPVISDRVDVFFSIEAQSDTPPHWLERAEEHFDTLELGSLYSHNASVELVQKRDWFDDTYKDEGSGGLKKELIKEAKSRRTPFPNAWQPALYLGLSESEEFCDGGFQKIEEYQKLQEPGPLP